MTRSAVLKIEIREDGIGSSGKTRELAGAAVTVCLGKCCPLGLNAERKCLDHFQRLKINLQPKDIFDTGRCSQELFNSLFYALWWTSQFLPQMTAKQEDLKARGRQLWRSKLQTWFSATSGIFEAPALSHRCCQAKKPNARAVPQTVDQLLQLREKNSAVEQRTSSRELAYSVIDFNTSSASKHLNE